uniref:DUF1353 domain-containing protein n=1 Tax=viral metagenome TaxID=1070528 RepID=A0A6H2A0L0_9ZZZZ
MSAFTDPLRIEQCPHDRRLWRPGDWHYYHVGSEDSDEVISVPPGRCVDLESKPWWSWSVVGHPLGPYAASGLFHDELYFNPANGVGEPRSRRRCDQIYLEMNIVLGCPWWKRTLKYSAVRIGGGGGWNRYREAQRAREIVAKIHEKYKDGA